MFGFAIHLGTRNLEMDLRCGGWRFASQMWCQIWFLHLNLMNPGQVHKGSKIWMLLRPDHRKSRRNVREWKPDPQMAADPAAWNRFVIFIIFN